MYVNLSEPPGFVLCKVRIITALTSQGCYVDYLRPCNLKEFPQCRAVLVSVSRWAGERKTEGAESIHCKRYFAPHQESFSPNERYKKCAYWQELDHHRKPEKRLASYGRDGEVIAFPLSLAIMLLAPKMRDAVL